MMMMVMSATATTSAAQHAAQHPTKPPTAAVVPMPMVPVTAMAVMPPAALYLVLDGIRHHGAGQAAQHRLERAAVPDLVAEVAARGAADERGREAPLAVLLPLRVGRRGALVGVGPRARGPLVGSRRGGWRGRGVRCMRGVGRGRARDGAGTAAVGGG